MGSTTGNWFRTESWILKYRHIDNCSGERRIPIFRSSPGLLASEVLGSPYLRSTHFRRQDRVDIYPYASYTYPGSLLMNSGGRFISSTDGEVVSLNAMKLRGGLEI